MKVVQTRKESVNVTKYVLGAVVVLGLLLMTCFVGCDMINPGYVGIKVNKMGSQRGVEDITVQTGLVFYNRLTTAVYEFPTFKQTTIWCRDHAEGKALDESMTFNSVEGAQINADVSLAYNVDGKKVPHLFVEFRSDLETITHGYLRNEVRDALNRHASTMKVVDIYGEKKQELLDGVKKDLVEKLTPKGFVIDYVSFATGLRVDPRVQESINSVIQQTQAAIAAEGKVRQIKAEADQKIESQRGISQSKVVDAEAELKVAELKAKANQLLSQSITLQLIQQEAVQKWNGTLPNYISAGGTAAVPFFQLPATQK